MIKHLTHILKGATSLMAILVLMLYFQSNLTFKHAHYLSDGSVIEHAHPVSSGTNTPHQHSDAQYQILSQLSNVSSEIASEQAHILSPEFCIEQNFEVTETKLVLHSKLHYGLRAPPAFL